MIFLQAIRNSVIGATHIFEKRIERRWNFFVLAFLTFGVIQILGLLAFYFIYFKIVGPGQGNMGLLLDYPGYEMFFYYSSYGSGLIYLFIVKLLHGAHSQSKLNYSFGNAFTKMNVTTFVVYLLSLSLVQLLAIYFSVHTEYSFNYYVASNENPLSQLLPESNWYEHFIYSGVLYLIDLLPWVIIACYAIYLRHSTFNLALLWRNRGYVLAVVMIVLAFFGLTDYVWQIISNFIMGTLSYAFVNELIPVIVKLCVYLVYGVISIAIAGHLLYYAVFNPNAKSSSQSLTDDFSSDILDQ